MNKQIKARWVRALRSGKYKQGKEALHQDGQYCCLGVLCDISGVGKWEVCRHVVGEQYVTGQWASFTRLTPQVMDWAGLKSLSGDLHMELMGIPDCSLVYLNDQGESFETIANVIEEHWEKL